MGSVKPTRAPGQADPDCSRVPFFVALKTRADFVAERVELFGCAITERRFYT